MSDAALSRACLQVLEILERHHGVGARGNRLPAWFAARLSRALERMQRDDKSTLDAVVSRLESDGARRSELADLLRVGETSFYRDAEQWDALRRHFIPGLGTSSLRALSVGCSTGEEAWTLAMLLDEACERGRARAYRVVAIDRSAVALESAEEAAYPSAVARHLPEDLGARYLKPSEETIVVEPALRARVRFVCRDVMTGLPPGDFEIIVCKNVLIYFGEEAGEKLLKVLFRSLAPRGALVVARSEVPRVRRLGYRAVELASGIIVFCPDAG
jgi:chemotaxis protein methyltransferase CheR